MRKYITHIREILVGEDWSTLFRFKCENEEERCSESYLRMSRDVKPYI
jgi:hypothetical protein